MDRILAT